MGLNDSISYVSGRLLLIDQVPLILETLFYSMKNNDWLNLVFPLVPRINCLLLPYFQLLPVKLPNWS